MAENTCPICNEGKLKEITGPFETRYMNRAGVEQALRLEDIRRLRCDACSEEILDDVASTQIETATRAAQGLLSCKEIRELRHAFGRTQVQMSKLLGIGAKSYCRWESGAFVQSLAFDNYLRILREVPEAGAVLIRLDRYGVAKPAALAAENTVEFEYLKDMQGTAESAMRFTQLMDLGMLHV